MEKVVTADRGREKVFIHPEWTNVGGGMGQDGGGQMYSPRQSRKTARATLYYKKKKAV